MVSYDKFESFKLIQDGILDAGVKNYVYKNGKRIEASHETSGKSAYKLQDMEQGLKRHHQLLRRQYFMDR